MAVSAIFVALLAARDAPAVALSLSHDEAVQIGHRIWQNECGGTLSGLTSWNAGEDFASLGIGHFIWYPAGKRGPFEESFPELLRYMRKRGAKLPQFLLPNDVDCPWKSRAQFLAASSSPEMKQLRNFLAHTIDLQADFLVARLVQSVPKIFRAIPTGKRLKAERCFERLSSSAQGCYALIDYVNFKGEGTLATERYRGRGWGLLQVLEGMSDEGPAVNAFSESAARVLRERVANSPPERHESRWLPGWLNRVATYRSF
ncbi:MAG: hypothetical protein ACREP1_05405 [Rhodanobacteraceae bacterium]